MAYLAAEGLGVFKVKYRLRTPIRVVKHTEGTFWRVVGSRSHAENSQAAFLQQLGRTN